MPDHTFVLVHGAWHGAWAWDAVVERLEPDHDVVAVDLPSSGRVPARLGDLADDTSAVRAAVVSVDGPVVLVGHSYGGLPITQLGAHEQVAHLVYVAAFQLDVGGSLLATLGGELPDWIEVVADGAATQAHRGQEVFYADVDEHTARQALERLQLQSMSSFTDELTAATWRDLPSTYLLAEQDRAIPPAAQEQMAQRAGTVHRLDASHSPFLAVPDRVVQLLTAIDVR